MLTLLVAGLVLANPVIFYSRRRDLAPTEAIASMSVTPEGAWSFSTFTWTNTAPYPTGVTGSGGMSNGAYSQSLDAQCKAKTRHTSAAYASDVAVTLTAPSPQSTIKFKIELSASVYGTDTYSKLSAKALYYFDASENNDFGPEFSISGHGYDSDVDDGEAQITFDSPQSQYVTDSIKDHFYLSVNAAIN